MAGVLIALWGTYDLIAPKVVAAPGPHWVLGGVPALPTFLVLAAVGVGLVRSGLVGTAEGAGHRRQVRRLSTAAASTHQ